MAKGPVRFKNSRRAPCPACLDRNALNLVGRPLFVDGVRKTAGCEVCGGSGIAPEVELIEGWPRPDLWVWVKGRKPPVAPLVPGPGVKITYTA